MAGIEFGWPLPKRQAFFKGLHTEYETELNFSGAKRKLPVWRIPIGLPRYRLLNGRTSSLQQEWLANNPNNPKDFFTGDPERDEVQKVQHEILGQLIKEKDLLTQFAKADNKQKDFLILDYLGFVVNGNRRLCAWRHLLAKDPQAYSHFAHINVIVLPKADDSAIDKLEGELQLDPDIRADYSWHAFANMIIDRMRLHHLDERALANFYNKRESEIRESIEMRNYAAEYLKARGKEGRWSEVNGTEEAFRKMIGKRKLIPGVGDKKLFEAGAFILLDDPGGGRLYDYIPDLHKYRKQVKEKLLGEFPIPRPIEAGDDLLGSDPDEIISQRLATAIDQPANRIKAAEVIKEAIEALDMLEREKDSTKFVLKQLQKANAAVQGALTGIHRPDNIRDGIAETINSIDAGLKALRAWLG